jgi:hypothetical protein
MFIAKIKKFFKKREKREKKDKLLKKQLKAVLKKAETVSKNFENYIKSNMVGGVTYKIGPVKSFVRSYEKVVKEKDGDISRLKDAYRASVFFDNLTQLYTFIAKLNKSKNKDFQVLAVEDTFYPRVVSGNINVLHEQKDITSRLYRDIKIIVVDTKWCIKGEIQLHFNQYLNVKAETYRMYCNERDLVDAIHTGFLRNGANKNMIRKLLYFRKSTIALNELAIIKYNLSAKHIHFISTKNVVKIYMKKYDIKDYDFALYDIILGRTLRKRGFPKNFYLKEFYRNDLDFIKSVIA